ncbi:MAG: hypothetical protein KF705_11430 [Phycisphaeraceae bacterium]|nr:hypothetical protein [Phycisphaeraceae bacterium]
MGHRQTPGPAGRYPEDGDLDDGTLVREESDCPGPALGTTPEELVDEELGEGAWQDWSRSVFRVEELLKSVEVSKRYFAGATRSVGYFTLCDDAARLRACFDAYSAGMSRIVFDYCNYDAGQILHARDAKDLAIEIVEGDLRAIGAEVVDDCVSVQMERIARIGDQARVVQRRIEALSARLREAQKAEGSSFKKLGFEFALAGLTALVPQMALLSKVVVYVGGSIIGDAIASPEKSAGRDVAESLATDPVEILDMTQDLMNRYGPEVELVGDVAGRVAGAAGFAFSLSDIASAKETVDEIKSMMAELNREHSKLMRLCGGMLPRARDYIKGREVRKQWRLLQRERLHRKRDELIGMMRSLGLPMS